MATLIGTLADIGYGVAWRVLDGRHFGVPQRRRRVFILGVRSDGDDPDGRAAAERAAAILAVGTRCGRHPATGKEKGQGPAEGAGEGVDGPIAPTITRSTGTPGGYAGIDDLLIAGNTAGLRLDRPPPDSDRVRAPDGLAGRVDDGGGLDPEGLDSHRYRCCGNGVIAPVAEWLGHRLMDAIQKEE